MWKTGLEKLKKLTNGRIFIGGSVCHDGDLTLAIGENKADTGDPYTNRDPYTTKPTGHRPRRSGRSRDIRHVACVACGTAAVVAHAGL